MISFKPDKDSTKVAVICGGPYNNKFVYITKDKPNPIRNLEEESVWDILDDEDFNMNKYRKYTYRDKLRLGHALKDKREPLEEYLIPRYNDLSKKVTDKLKKELDLSTGVMVPIPSEESERIFIAGKSGAGKSCLAALYGSEYQRMNPDKTIYLFTKHEDEDAYKAIDLTEVLHDDELLEEPVDITTLKDSLVIFDDCDHIQDKTVSKNVSTLNNDLITAGRKYNIHTVTLQHQLMDYKATRNLLNEANKVIFFNSGCSYHISRYLKTYVGLSPETIKKIMNLRSRWTMLHLGTPGYVLHEHGIFII